MNSTSIEATLVFEELKKHLLNDGDVCPYAALKAVMDKDPQTDGYGYAVTARKRFEREFDCVLQPIKNVGVRRATAREVINRGSSDLKHLRRATGRSIRRQMTLVNPEKLATLNGEERSAHLAQTSQMGVLAHCLKPSATKKIRQATDASCRVLPSAETLALFQKPREVEQVQ